MLFNVIALLDLLLWIFLMRVFGWPAFWIGLGLLYMASELQKNHPVILSIVNGMVFIILGAIWGLVYLAVNSKKRL